MPVMPTARIEVEIAYWKHCHPKNFVAKAVKLADGRSDLMLWEVGIPGPHGTAWDGGIYRLLIQFPEAYPFSPPSCYFSPPIFHPNVSLTGRVVHPLLLWDGTWKKETTALFVCKAIQEMLKEPLPDYIANAEAFLLYRTRQGDYFQKVLGQAKEYPINQMFERYWP